MLTSLRRRCVLLCSLGVLAINGTRAQVASTEQVNQLLIERGAQEGCLLDGSYGKPIAAYVKRAGSSGLLVMNPDAGGSCRMGTLRFSCTELAVTDDEGRELDAICRSCKSTDSSGQFWLCKSWNGRLKVPRLATEAFATEGFSGGSVGTRGALLFGSGETGATGDVPAALIDDAGNKAKLVGTTPEIRARSPDDAIDQIRRLGIGVDAVSWIGVDDKRPIVTNDRRVFGDGVPAGSQVVTEAKLITRLGEFKSAAQIEDLTLDAGMVHRALMLMMMDPTYDAQTILDKGYAFAPEIYLLE